MSWSPDEAIAAVSLITAGLAGLKYYRVQQENAELQKKVGELVLIQKLQKNKEETDSHFAGRSDDDVLSESIADGSKVPKP